MKKLSIIAKIIAFASIMSAPCAAMAQMSVEPENGALVRLDRSNFWSIKQMATVGVADQVKLGEGLRTPVISPDGQKVILSQPSRSMGEIGKLYQWTEASRQAELVIENKDISTHITWTDNDSFYVRERTAPFMERGQKLNFSMSGKKAEFRSRMTLHDRAVIVFDADDIIMMKRNHKMLAISDITIDRYSGPKVSSDEKFVVFSGLTTGVNLYDINQNGVVYQDPKGSDPRFSPDGKFLVYNETSDDGHVITQGDIIIVDLHTQARTRVSNPKGEIRLHASLSNDARYIAWENINGETYKARLAW